MPRKKLRSKKEVRRTGELLDNLPAVATLRKYIELEKVYLYTEFCNILGMKKCIGRKRPAQFEEWSKRLDFEFFPGEKIQDDSLVVHKIKSYQPIDRSVTAFSPNAVYPPLLFSVLTKEMKKGQTITLTKKQLLKMFNLIKEEPIIPDELKKSDEYSRVKTFYYLKASSTVDTALESLVRHKFIRVERKRYIFRNGQGEFEADPLHSDIASDVERTVKRQAKTLDEVYESGKVYMKEYTSWDRSYYKYTITLLQKMKPTIDDDMEQLYEKRLQMMSKISDRAEITSIFV